MAGQLGINSTLVERASRLAKCDLLTDMVGELPELQGIMGRYYAVESGEDPEVARALDEQYMPRVCRSRPAGNRYGQNTGVGR